MAKFKKGDRVRCIGNSAFMSAGEVGTVDEDGSTVPFVVVDGRGKEPVPEGSLELIKGDSMNVGDILVANNGATRKVLAYLNQGIELYALSGWDEDETDPECIYWFTKAGIEDMYLRLITDTTVEKSVSDLEKELKMQPGTLRIRKD